MLVVFQHRYSMKCERDLYLKAVPTVSNSKQNEVNIKKKKKMREDMHKLPLRMLINSPKQSIKDIG